MRIARILTPLLLLALGCNADTVVHQVTNKVKETVTMTEMHDLHLMMSLDEVNNNRMPTAKEVRDYAKKENPKLSKLLEDGVIVLTDTKKRDSVWAYEKDAPTKGGWVVAGSGESKMTAEEVQKALGK